MNKPGSDGRFSKRCAALGEVLSPKNGLRRHVRSTSPTRYLPWGAESAPHRGAGHGFVPEEPHGGASRSAQGPCRAPPGSEMRSSAPATRKAAGVPSAGSQPSQSTHERPRRWCDAGSPGRQCVPAAQKAGIEGMVRNTGSDRDRGRILIRGRLNQPASVHHHRRRDAGATNIAAHFVAPPSRGR